MTYLQHNRLNTPQLEYALLGAKKKIRVHHTMMKPFQQVLFQQESTAYMTLPYLLDMLNIQWLQFHILRAFP